MRAGRCRKAEEKKSATSRAGGMLVTALFDCIQRKRLYLFQQPMRERGSPDLLPSLDGFVAFRCPFPK